VQILIVTNQLIKEENDSYYCIENLYDILERFAQMGTLHICAQKYAGKSSNTVDKDVSALLSAENIHYVTKSFIRPTSKSKEIIEKCVKNADLIIGYVPNNNASYACKLSQKYKKKFLSYVVSCPWDAFWNHGLLGKILASYAFFELRNTLRKSDFALYVTNQFLQRRYPCPGITCGCSDVRIVDLNERILNDRIARLDVLSEKDVLKIATIANYSVKYKGQHFVISALAQLKKMGVTKFHYYLVGGGNKERLENLARSLNVSELVHFEGIVPHSQIFEKLDEMHLYIQPSLQEGLPRSVVEAMSRGLLCICANTAAMPEMVDPKYIVKRKSVSDIVEILKNISIDDLKNQSVRNFNESKKYAEEVLAKKRNSFFELVKNNF